MSANYIGIDFSQAYFDLFMAGPQGQPLAPVKRFANDTSGCQVGLQFILQTSAAHPADQVLIAGEATGMLWWHLYCSWAADPHLAALRPVFYLLNPAQVKSFRKNAPQQDKTDPIDARLIYRCLLNNLPDLIPWLPDRDNAALRFLTRFRYHLARRLAAFKIYANTWIYLKASAYDQVEPFSDTFGVTSVAFLRRYPSFASLTDSPLPEIAAQIRTLGRGRFKDPSENARRLQKVAQLSYPLDPNLVPAIHFILDDLLDLIASLEKCLARLDQHIETLVAQDADIVNLRSLGGLGPVFAAGLAAEMRPTQRFLQGQKFHPNCGAYLPRTQQDAIAAVAKLAGLWWPRNESGTARSEDRHMPQACNPYLRYYLVEAANHVRGHVAEYGAFYTRKFKQATKHHHRRALVLTARKLARLVFVLLHTHQTYQPRREISA